MGKYLEGTITQYMQDAASNKSAPGGGSVSALSGALGAAMGEMASNFTVGKKKYADVEEAVRASLSRLQEARKELERLVDEDVAAYSSVTEAQSLPKDTEEQKNTRQRRLQKALESAMLVPLNIMRRCSAVSEEAVRLADTANPYLMTDVGVCAMLAEAACSGARFNVEVNLKYMDNPSLEKQVREETESIMESVRSARSKVEAKVLAGL